MKRQTTFIVYVDKTVIANTDRTDLFDAVFAHLVLKKVRGDRRKKFMREYMQAGHRGIDPVTVINRWVQVRPMEEFPFRQGDEGLEEPPLYEVGDEEESVPDTQDEPDAKDEI